MNAHDCERIGALPVERNELAEDLGDLLDVARKVRDEASQAGAPAELRLRTRRRARTLDAEPWRPSARAIVSDQRLPVPEANGG